jgi:hypothetical protein
MRVTSNYLVTIGTVAEKDLVYDRLAALQPVAGRRRRERDGSVFATDMSGAIPVLVHR